MVVYFADYFNLNLLAGISDPTGAPDPCSQFLVNLMGGCSCGAPDQCPQLLVESDGVAHLSMRMFLW